MHQTGDTPPELSPIFSFLNIHTNKLYHEGYFLKLNDLDSRKRSLALVHCGARANTWQMDGLLVIDNGWNATHSWSELFFHYGMALRWTQQVEKRFRLPLSIWPMRLSKW